MNPCPCGHLGDPRHACTCLAPLIERYRGRISGPLLDRIDLHVEMPALSLRELRAAPGEPSSAVAARIAAARTVQLARFGLACSTTPSLDRILKVGRTLADLEGAPAIRTSHVAEAIQYRALDRRILG